MADGIGNLPIVRTVDYFSNLFSNPDTPGPANVGFHEGIGVVVPNVVDASMGIAVTTDNYGKFNTGNDSS